MAMGHPKAYLISCSRNLQKWWVGRGSNPRLAEIDYLLDFLDSYSKVEYSARAKEMRLLGRDCIELLICTVMRYGNESLHIKWKLIEWDKDTNTDKRYLRIWVSSKTGHAY